MLGYCRTLALAALLPAIAAAQTNSARLEWQHSGAGVANFRLFAGRSPTTLGQMVEVGSAERMGSIDGLADGVWYFAATAVAPSPSRAESPISNVLCLAFGTGVCPIAVPGVVRNLVVTPITTPPPLPAIAVTVRNCGTPIDWCQLVVTGAGTVTLRASSGVFDWNDFSVAPNLGVNNDGLNSPTITFTGPSPTSGNGWWFETDNVTGFASITVNGVTIPMTFANNAWTARTP